MTSNPDRTLLLSPCGLLRVWKPLIARTSTVDRFLFLLTMSCTSSDSEMSFDSEGSEIYYIAEVETEVDDDSRL